MMKPSKQTIAGSSTSLCSAMRKAWMVLSYASWEFSAKIWIQPASRQPIESEWSQWMLIGPLSARLTSGITIGSRQEAAMYTISHISARPCEEVAVKTRAPAAEAPMAALMALCSDSTRITSVSTSPLATNSANLCISSVCGVIGYADATSGRTCLRA